MKREWPPRKRVYFYDEPGWPEVDEHAGVRSTADLFASMRVRRPHLTPEQRAGEQAVLDEWEAAEHAWIDNPGPIDWDDVIKRQAAHLEHVRRMVESGKIRPDQAYIYIGRGVELRVSPVEIPPPVYPRTSETS